MNKVLEELIAKIETDELTGTLLGKVTLSFDYKKLVGWARELERENSRLKLQLSQGVNLERRSVAAQLYAGMLAKPGNLPMTQQLEYALEQADKLIKATTRSRS